MCLILMAYRRIPDVELLFASNRDERFDRPAAFAHSWDDREGPPILAGRDLEAGGTWLGVSRSGRLAAVTNIREPEANSPEAPSRGDLPVKFLSQNNRVAEFARIARGTFGDYNPFNLVLWDGETLAVVSNRIDEMTTYPPGFHGISNGLPASNWPKVSVGRRRLEALADSGRVPTESVLEIMRDEDRADDDALPNTGVGLSLERRLSPAFIRMEGYGTRCTTVVRFRRDGTAEFDEYSYGFSGDIVNHEHVEFSVTGA